MVESSDGLKDRRRRTDGEPDALVVDRNRLFAEAVTPLLEDLGFTVSVATAARTARAFVASVAPALVLVDLSLPEGGGLAIGRMALATRSDAVVVGVTTAADPGRLRESRRAGFRGCVSKDTPVTRFKTHMRAAIEGKQIEPYRPDGRHGSRRSYPPTDVDLLAAQLTSREREVLELLVEGAGGSRIAEHLQISPNTVRTHVQSILTKLQVHSRLEATAVAVRHGLVNGHRPAEPGAA